MPNWCENHLILKHNDPAMIDRAARAFEEGRLLSEFVPIPEPLRNTVAGAMADGYERDLHEATQAINEKYFGYRNWYDFCVTEWGTKWDVGGRDAFLHSKDSDHLNVSFESAWSPPTGVYCKLQELGFDVQAYYYEPGCGFVGLHNADGDQCFDVKDEAIPADLLAMFGSAINSGGDE